MTCVICQEPVHFKDFLMYMLDCGSYHQDHGECLSAWVYRTNAKLCPTCKTPIRCIDQLKTYGKHLEYLALIDFLDLIILPKSHNDLMIWIREEINKIYADVIKYPDIGVLWQRSFIGYWNGNRLGLLMAEAAKKCDDYNTTWRMLCTMVELNHTCTDECRESVCFIYRYITTITISDIETID